MKNSSLIPLVCVLALLCGMTSCHSSKNVHKNKYHASVPVRPLKETAGAHRLLEEAYTWLGTPYAYAKAEKGEGTDCSGMVMKLYLEVAGCAIPRNSAKQAEFCEPLKEKDVQAGDLVFFATGKDPERVSHVGIMIDSGSFIHASSSKGVVISQLDTPYYRRTFRMYGRVPSALGDL